MAYAGMDRNYRLILDQEEATQANHAIQAEIERLRKDEKPTEGAKRYLKTLEDVHKALAQALSDRS